MPIFFVEKMREAFAVQKIPVYLVIHCENLTVKNQRHSYYHIFSFISNTLRINTSLHNISETMGGGGYLP